MYRSEDSAKLLYRTQHQECELYYGCSDGGCHSGFLLGTKIVQVTFKVMLKRVLLIQNLIIIWYNLASFATFKDVDFQLLQQKKFIFCIDIFKSNIFCL